MVLKDYTSGKDRMIRIKSSNPEVFRQAYEELYASVNYARENFSNTTIYTCLKGALDFYTIRYNSLKN